MIQKAARTYIEQLISTLEKFPYNKIESLVELLVETRKQANRVFIFGNGGSATTASHMACDLTKDKPFDTELPLKVISLTDNVALLTAAGNDLGYEEIFIKQLRNLLQPNDVVIAISASGNSENILRAMEYARQKGAIRVGITGFDGGKIKENVDICIWIDNQTYGQVEDVHLIINHLVTAVLQDASVIDRKNRIGI
ncbi:MAG: SIS domain-containing protein [Phycisphaerae bacterium]|nr:SIS domain-containing protein [Phycisphaerae bacterium]